MGKVEFSSGREEHNWQAMAAGLALWTIPAVKAVLVMMISGQLFTSKSRCHFCLFLPLPLPHKACGSFYPKPLSCPTEGARLSAVLGKGKVLHQCFSALL